MQARNDGKHVILPAAAPIERRPDRARMPVTMPRQSDGKLHRDGSRAATVQPKHPVAECGRVHGASELHANERKRIAEYRFVYHRSRKEKRRWMQSLAKHDRLRGPDKCQSARPDTKSLIVPTPESPRTAPLSRSRYFLRRLTAVCRPRLCRRLMRRLDPADRTFSLL